MSRKLLSLSFTAALMGGTVYADVPKVAVDIAPVHSLVTRVMDGVGSPDLIVQLGASPHEYSLRPSEARALQDADVVFWVSAGLTPWLEDTIETLSSEASVTELLETDGTIELEFRESALFEKHDHSDHDEGHGDHDDHDDHGHGAHDPHAWLSPNNAMNWLNVIAGQLSAADPENAGVYFANAAAGRAEIEAVIGEVNATLAPVRGEKFIVFHDAYQYFENDFDFPAAGAISIGDASDPSPARIAEIQARVADEGIACVLAEPQFNQGLVATVLEGSQAHTGIIDPLGSDLELGAGFYPQLIKNLASSLAACK
ncbi:zinc transporter [Loktanella sp. D2R18]|uniref:zinc ABC transporter substrate-binding protein n=1 Tax=Rhodobacterales TaxID=204455 RepID=UPI000DE85F58|nr:MULTISPECIES: zinc ABC transporter substrate-binding protein [Rhodobacterales]MDO6590563.1 zinc ABC transporter substrate-binding protein [Yoonia sp. 1_MG-2023]RBW41279.1 zinc transporter [Loktanella sp. D2R18]